MKNNGRAAFVAQFRSFLADGGAASAVRKGKRKEKTELGQMIAKQLETKAPLSPGGEKLFLMIAQRLGLRGVTWME